MPTTKDVKQIWNAVGSFWDKFEQKEVIEAA